MKVGVKCVRLRFVASEGLEVDDIDEFELVFVGDEGEGAIIVFELVVGEGEIFLCVEDGDCFIVVDVVDVGF